MEHARARSATLRIADDDEGMPRPAWRMLGWTFAIAMVFWALGILELPSSLRRVVDWLGGLTVLTVLVLWVRANARSLAMENEAPNPGDDVRVRMIRSRRPPVAAIGGPHIRPAHRRRGGPRS